MCGIYVMHKRITSDVWMQEKTIHALHSMSVAATDRKKRTPKGMRHMVSSSSKLHVHVTIRHRDVADVIQTAAAHTAIRAIYTQNKTRKTEPY